MSNEQFLSDVSINILVNHSKDLIDKYYRQKDNIKSHEELIAKRVSRGITNNEILEKVIKTTESRRKEYMEELLLLKKDLEKLGKTIVMDDNGLYLENYTKPN